MSIETDLVTSALKKFDSCANWSVLSQSKFVSLSLIVSNPSKPWDWFAVVKNPNVSLSFIFEHPQFKWNWQAISQHPSVTWETVMEHPNKPWNWKGLSANPSISWDIVCCHSDKPWSWFRLSQNPSITFDTVFLHPEKPWDWQGLSRNPHLTWEIVYSQIVKPWDWSFIFENINTIPGNVMQFIQLLFTRDTFDDLNMTKQEVFDVLSSCKHVPISLIMETASIYPWNWNRVIDHPEFHWKLAKGNKYFTNWYRISQHSSVQWEDVIRHPKLPWNWKGLTSNASISWDIIARYPQKPWCMKELAKNHSISIDTMLLDTTHAYEHIHWDWNTLSYHPRLTWQVVTKHIDKPWNWTKLSERFDALMQQEVCRYKLAARKIQRWWLDLYYNPSRSFCLRRIRRVCDELNAALIDRQ